MDPRENKTLEQKSFIIENNILKGAVKEIDLSRKLGQLIFDALDEHADYVSQIEAESGEQTTFAEMKERSVRCALWMEKENIGRDDFVVVCTHNHLDSYVPVFATFFVDAIFTAWHYQLRLDTARQFMKRCKPKVIFASEQACDVLVEASKLENVHAKIVVFGKHAHLENIDEIMARQSPQEIDNFVPKNAKTLDDVAVVLLSSGTSALSKGIMLSNRGLLHMLRRSDELMPKNVRGLWYMTLDWMAGLMVTVLFAMKRGIRVIDSVYSQFDNESFCRIVERHKVAYLVITPYELNCLLKSHSIENYNLTSLKIILAVGNKVHEEVLRSAKIKLPSATVGQPYALTEIGTVTSGKDGSPSSCGVIWPNVQVKIVDVTTNNIVGPNEQGEIWVLSPTVMIGYYEEPEKTRESFDEGGWFRTGDLGYYNESGEIFVTDRLKDTFKYRHYTVYPWTIERVLMTHPDVAEAAVVSVPDAIDFDLPAAFVKTVTGSKVTKDELMELTAKLEDHNKLRGGLYFVDCLPKTASGKIKKNELRRMLAEGLVNEES